MIDLTYLEYAVRGLTSALLFAAVVVVLFGSTGTRD